MRLKVLIVPDKFKGTLTARSAAEAIACGWLQARRGDSLELLPMSDGGDGFGEVMSALLGAKPQAIATCDAAHRACAAKWWWEPNSRTAIIESASVVGLAMLPAKRYHPFELDSYGLGAVVSEVIAKGAKRCLVGLGGSATNEGGFGLARALGWKFVNERGQAIEHWTELPSVTELRRPRRVRISFQVVAAVDVQNQLLGPHGATRIYGPQKGLKAHDFPIAEKCLTELVALVEGSGEHVLSLAAGAGAAGGLGFGFAAFLAGSLEPGFELFAQEVDLKRRLGTVDLVITGEGQMDHSTFMGKGAGAIARLCQDLGVACIGLAGNIDPRSLMNGHFAQARSLTSLTTLLKAKAQPALWLERLAKEMADDWTAREKLPLEIERGLKPLSGSVGPKRTK